MNTYCAQPVVLLLLDLLLVAWSCKSILRVMSNGAAKHFL